MSERCYRVFHAGTKLNFFLPSILNIYVFHNKIRSFKERYNYVLSPKIAVLANAEDFKFQNFFWAQPWWAHFKTTYVFPSNMKIVATGLNYKYKRITLPSFSFDRESLKIQMQESILLKQQQQQITMERAKKLKIKHFLCYSIPVFHL